MSDRDLATEALLEFLNAAEAGIVSAKRIIGERKGVGEAVKEETFAILKWESQQGAKIGAYEVAYKANNHEENWTHAYNVLKQNNAVINSRYHGEGYQFTYWLYGEGKIYRQRISKQV